MVWNFRYFIPKHDSQFCDQQLHRTLTFIQDLFVVGSRYEMGSYCPGPGRPFRGRPVYGGNQNLPEHLHRSHVCCKSRNIPLNINLTDYVFLFDDFVPVGTPWSEVRVPAITNHDRVLCLRVHPGGSGCSRRS